MNGQGLQQIVWVRSTQAENAYGRFAAEILQNEGLPEFRAVEFDGGTRRLGEGDVAVLTRCFLTAAEIDALLEDVQRGASLVVLQPSVPLARRLGWNPSCRVHHPARVQLPGVRWLEEAVQVHVPVAGWTPSDAVPAWRVLAEAVSGDGRPAGCPAAVMQPWGRGRVALFFYDLAAAVARIRFGDPEMASLLTNGHWHWHHACDLFEGQIDPGLQHLPQADIHAQLLADTVLDIAPRPLARVWYYPRVGQRSAAVFQSDDDGSLPEEFDALAEALQTRGATGTFYLMRETHLDDARMEAMRRAGHTFAPHVDHTVRPDEAYFSYPAALEDETGWFDRRYGDRSATMQAHCAPWMGYMPWVPLHIRYGYRLLFAFMSIPPGRFGSYMCGSGRPIKFFDRDGTLYDSWQQPVIVYDDSSVQESLTLRPESALEQFRMVLQAALDTHHTAFGLLSHPLSFARYSRGVVEGVLDMLAEAGVPIVNGDRWLQFNDRRRGVRMHCERCGDVLRWRIDGVLEPMTILVPRHHACRGYRVDGQALDPPLVDRLGREYAAFELEGTCSEVCLEMICP